MIGLVRSRVAYNVLRQALKRYNSSSSAVPRPAENALNRAISFADKRIVQVSLAGGDYDFPWLWLRDNCRCTKCFNPVSHSRVIDWAKFDVKIKPQNIAVTDEILTISWSDGHSSSYALPWLLERSFTKEAQEDWLENVYKPTRVSWGAEEFRAILKRFKFQDIIFSDSHLLGWCEAMATSGIAVIEDIPSRQDQMRLFANRVACIKRTHFGEDYVLKAEAGATNVAYFPTPLQMHTDLPYYEYKPGLNLLHSVVQCDAKTGINQLTDGLRVAERLKNNQPDVYKILSETPVDWTDLGTLKGDDWFTIFRSPVICENKEAKLFRINYSSQERDSQFSVPIDIVNQWYEAHAIFTEELHNPENAAFIKMQSGEMLTFDNLRVIHGRTAYSDTPGQERLLVGAFMDWDFLYSKMRILRGTDKLYKKYKNL